MKVLFVFKESLEIKNYLIRAQGESLIKQGIVVEYFTIPDGGLSGYLMSLFKLRKIIKANKFDLIHSHYSYSSIISALSGKIPVVASLMGSDTKRKIFIHPLLYIFHHIFWKATIVKSLKMKTDIGFKKAYVIPNGVNLEIFKHESFGSEKKEKLNFRRKYNLLFVSFGKISEVKNFNLAKEAYKLLTDIDLGMHIISRIDQKELVDYYNSADLLLLTSFSEGSPNVIKEAMACNCPIVSTDVGDVQEVFGDTNGCFVCSYDPYDVAEKIKQALNFSQFHGRTKGRERIIELGLDSETIADKLITIYCNVLNLKF
jgi:teichuronic acid biosynthesis glycosyltransferase TuaC